MPNFIEDEATPSLLIANPPAGGNLNRKTSQFDFSSGATFKNIDQLCVDGIITATETAVFKAKSMKLHEALKRSRENEFKLHTLMKHCLSELKRQEAELAKADQFPDNAGTEPLMLRAEIIKTYNNAMELEERAENLAYEEGLLREERKLLKRDYSRLPLSELEALGEDVNIFGVIEQRFRDLQSLHQEAEMEVEMLKMEAKRFTEQARIAKENLEDTLSEYTDVQSRLNRIKVCLVTRWLFIMEMSFITLVGTSNCKSNFVSYREIEKNKEISKENKKNLEERTRDLADWQDLEMEVRTEKAKLAQRLDIFVSEKKEGQQEQTKLRWEKDNYLKKLKNSQVQLEAAVDSVKNATAGFEKARARFAVAPKYDKNLLILKEKLGGLIADLHNEIAEEEHHIEEEQIRINELVSSTKGRLKVLESSKAENLELLQLATTISEDLAKAVCEFTSAFYKHSRLSEDFQVKKQIIERQLEELGNLEASHFHANIIIIISNGWLYDIYH
ncbi:unnamed protein product [Rodentolepis nana]|uniref:Coiled-coil domain-containing protein 175 n=1 Tax=Rodentolepis nana TaxID=102285 RepID=A0A158QHX4_RODNA|nr:unnamed protein product [Rodentolepis nana]